MEFLRKIVRNYHRKKGNFYPALVSEINGDVAVCDVQVGRVEMTLNFPYSALKHYQLAKTDRFRWFPTKDGSVSYKDIEPVECAATGIGMRPLPENFLETLMKSE